MKKIITILCTLLVPLYLFAGITTYTFTSYKWASKIGSTKCDGTTDGWISDKDAYIEDYSEGRYDAQGLPYSWGVDVKKSTSGAGATSVLSFTDVRRITFNFCQNASGGKGVIHVKVGDNEEKSFNIKAPALGEDGKYNRDSIILYSTPQTGKIKFWVECTENAIYINSISIRSAAGGNSVFTTATYQLVTDSKQLKDSDQVIFGVHKDGVNYIMGYFDEWTSKNNIAAIKGRYSVDRNTVEPDENAIYTIRTAELNGNDCYIFQDEIRYEEAYLVASGGQTKNRLALWTDVVDKNTYGNYGFWDIQLESGGEAVITNLGKSKAKIIQYNATDNIFACYENRSQTGVCLYRHVEATGDVAAIVAPLINFGTTIKQTDKKTILVNANKLSQDISVSLKDGSNFSLSATSIDRDGDYLTISYDLAAAGHYVDTLILTSGSVEKRVAVVLSRINPISVNEAVAQEDYTTVYLKDVIVTKKYDNYIYVRDATGSMLLFDRGDGTKRFGKDVEQGHKLSGVTGRFVNYYGVPEVSPNVAFSFNKSQKEDVQPEVAPTEIDSSYVCKYLVLDGAVVNSWTSLTYKGKEYAVANKFNLASFTKNVPTKTYVIVSYDQNVVTLYIIKQESATGIDHTMQKGHNARLIMRDGVVIVETESGLYSLQGEKIL